MPDHEGWEEINVGTWSDFDKVISDLSYRKWVYRGQNNAAWPVKTSLYRLFEDSTEIIKLSSNKNRQFAKDSHEKLLIKKFKANAHLYLSSTPDEGDTLEWLSLMQHFGAPTRMLDVTLSPHIACYFALESGHEDAAIYAFNYARIKKIDSEISSVLNKKNQIFKNHKNAKSFIIAHESMFANERLLSQQGLFLVPSSNYHTFDELLDVYGAGGDVCKKIILNSRLRYEGVERLRGMNITSSTLFPGIDGFCKSLKHQVYENSNLQKIFE